MWGGQTKLCFEKHVKERGLCKIDSTAGAQNGAKRCPDVDSVAKDRSGAGDNEYGEMSRTAKCVHCFWAHGSRSAKSATRGPKTQAELAAVIISEFQKRKSASIACRPTAPVRKKMRHVVQSEVSKSHFDHANPYHADFDISNSLCR